MKKSYYIEDDIPKIMMLLPLHGCDEEEEPLELAELTDSVPDDISVRDNQQFLHLTPFLRRVSISHSFCLAGGMRMRSWITAKNMNNSLKQSRNMVMNNM